MVKWDGSPDANTPVSRADRRAGGTYVMREERISLHPWFGAGLVGGPVLLSSWLASLAPRCPSAVSISEATRTGGSDRDHGFLFEVVIQLPGSWLCSSAHVLIFWAQLHLAGTACLPPWRNERVPWARGRSGERRLQATNTPHCTVQWEYFHTGFKNI